MKRIVILATALLALGACATGFDVMTDHDPAQDFSNYETFSWISNTPLIRVTNQPVNPMLETRLMAITEETLRGKGYRYVRNPGQADFVISFTVGARDKIRVTTYPAGYGYRGYGWGGGYWGATQVDARQYTEGMLAIDVFDVGKKTPVWHGAGTKSITRSDRDNLDETIRSAVGAILADFPPS